MVSSGKPSINKEDILKVTSEIKILYFYTGITKVPCLICSPFRKDKHPSFSIFSPDGTKIYYKDFSTRESGTLFGFLASLWGISYEKALSKIYKDFTDKKSENSILKINTALPKIYKNKNFQLDVKVRSWKKYDIEFWESFGISKKWLKLADVYPISNIFITKEGVTNIFGAEKYAYVYVEKKDNKVSLKVYQPYSTNFKWLSSMDKSVWSLWTKIPKTGKNLFITSSLKDALNLWSNLNIPAISMQGEGYLPKEKVINELKERYENIIVFYDNDYTNDNNPGRTDSLNLVNTYGLKRVDIPAEYEAKDPSDLYKKYGEKEYKEIMNKILTNIII